MRFVELSNVRGLTIDWDAPVELTDEIRAGMAGHHVEAMRAGILRRGHVTRRVTFIKGALAFSSDPVRRSIFLQMPELDDDEVFEDELSASVETGDSGEVHRIVVDPSHAGDRIDAVIAAATSLSRALAQRLIDDGHVRIDTTVITKANHRVRAGNTIEVARPIAQPIELVAEAIPLVVLYEDADLIVIDKPAGLVVHPAVGHERGTLVNALLHHCKDLAGIAGELRPGIVHRLDKDTTGVMVAAKTEAALAGLTAAFAAKSRGEAGGAGREYLGIAAPGPKHDGGTITTLHARHTADRRRFTSKTTSGKHAVTHWQILEQLRDAALIRFRLETGRTHQIRVHAYDSGWPLLGDQLYVKPQHAYPELAARLGRQALHAEVLEFDHPSTAERMRFVSPMPADFAAALAELRPTRSST
ncbi:MAG: RluA family pseudouridine synthase [Kofleriaceae bacterium]